MFSCPYYSYGGFYRLTEPESYVRILHASPNAPAVDVYVNNRPVFRNLSYKNFSDYVSLPPGLYNIKVFPAGTKTKAVVDTNLFIPGQKIFTVAAIGNAPNISLLPIEDVRRPKIPNKALVRFAHLSPNAPNVDITLPNGTVLFSNVGYKDVTQYIPVDPGVYTLEAREAGTNKKVLIVPNIRLSPNRFYTVYAVGDVSKAPGLQVLIPLDGNSYLQF